VSRTKTARGTPAPGRNEDDRPLAIPKNPKKTTTSGSCCCGPETRTNAHGWSRSSTGWIPSCCSSWSYGRGCWMSCFVPWNASSLRSAGLCGQLAARRGQSDPPGSRFMPGRGRGHHASIGGG
jgi:hypothetical protein